MPPPYTRTWQNYYIHYTIIQKLFWQASLGSLAWTRTPVEPVSKISFEGSPPAGGQAQPPFLFPLWIRPCDRGPCGWNSGFVGGGGARGADGRCTVSPGRRRFSVYTDWCDLFPVPRAWRASLGGMITWPRRARGAVYMSGRWYRPTVIINTATIEVCTRAALRFKTTPGNYDSTNRTE